MGFIFTGIAVNEKFEQKQIDSFAFRFGCNSLEFDKELDFEEALNVDYEDEYLDFIFFKNSTLIFIPFDFALTLKARQASYNCETLFFSLNEFSMAMMVYYYRDIERIKILTESNGEIRKNIDNGLEIPYKDADDLIFKLIENVTKVSFWDIENNTKVYRYRPTEEKPLVNRTDLKWEKRYLARRKQMSNANNNLKVAKKKWWKI
ncbi:hypothetical protein [Kordia sp.]|uniref:hypothetical protein n=1 Tax=Kordia sp. TaxID=1965332 RepID=UPI003D6BFDA6